MTSTIDSASFFVAANGRTDPEAELAATLAAFFSDVTHAGEPTHCRFRARYEWLKDRLSIDASRLPEQRCELYDSWALGNGPFKATLVFASGDMSGPSTMFGHTLLRLDTANTTDSSVLLSNAVNYAAAVDPDVNAFSYALRGLGGGYIGQYSVMPYHQKVREYVRIEQRDIWEYPLQLSTADVRRMLWHLWELRGQGAQYFFFSENCSYMLLALIETARDGLDLTSSFDGLFAYVIPADTVGVLRGAGLVALPVFRPSIVRKLSWQLATMDALARDWVIDYANGMQPFALTNSSFIDLRDEARRLETANEYIHYLFQADSITRDEGLPRTHAALKARSENPAAADFPPVPVPPAPHTGHESSRLELGWRVDEHHDAALVGIRPAYHDRLDPTDGYLPGAEIEFFELSLAVGERPYLDRFTLVSVQSLVPWDRAFRPWLWQAQGGLRRFGLDAISARPQLGLGAYVEGGAGVAAGSTDTAMVYSFAMLSADGNPDVRDGYALAAGLRLGLWLPWSNSILQQLEIDGFAPAGGGAETLYRAQLATHFQVTPRNGLRLNLHYTDFDGVDLQSAELRWLHYF